MLNKSRCKFVLACVLLVLGWSVPVQAEHRVPLSFAVLSAADVPVTRQSWEPIVKAVNSRLSEIELHLQVLNLEEMEHAVQEQQVDFVLLNSALYIKLSHEQVLSSPLASLLEYKQGIPLRDFGGVILARNERGGIERLEQLRGKVVAVPGLVSLGGYLTQAYELQQQGIEPGSYQLLQTELPHTNAVAALLQGEADAAFVRTGVLEAMLESGQVEEGRLRVLNAQPEFPYALSTRLYPEWPLAALAHVPLEHAAQVTGVFLMINAQGPLFTQADQYGFTIPSDYEPVREIMRSLKVSPYDVEDSITLRQVWDKYRLRILLGALFVAVIILLSLLLLLYNRKLTHTLAIVRKNEDSLRLSAVAFETQEAIMITDAHERILRVNKAFVENSGFNSQEVLGKTPRIFQSGRHDLAFYQEMWGSILERGYWSGEIWNRRKDGTTYPIRQAITAVKDVRGQISHFLSTFTDITAHKQAEERIHQLAFYDPLTGLANRRLLEEQIRQLCQSATQNHAFNALLFIDLDHFKQLNDTLGYRVGDELLKQVARRIKAVLGEEDRLARQAGDDFIVLLQRLGKNQDDAVNAVQQVGKKIMEAICQPYQLFEHRYVITASIGINLFQCNGETVDELLKRSDMAMYQAKAEGRHTIRFFDPAMQEVANTRVHIEAQLRRALDEEHFLLYYQPKVSYQGELHGYEALLRWQHPERGMIPPMEFIPVAEETGLIVPVGKWVIQEACNTLAKWQKSTERANHILAINISAIQFRQPDFVSSVIDCINGLGVRGELLELELTESLLLENIDDAVGKMSELKKLGIRFSLDDFGTGYSSLSYLKDLPLDSLKIDQSFVRDMLVSADDAAIVETVITLAKSLRLSVIAEGVEEEAQARFLHELGCDLLQGYFFGRPGQIDFD